MRAIGQAIATLARQRGDTQVVIGRDGRLSGPALAQALAQGLQAGGLSVIDLGQVTTPMVYFAVHELGTGTGVMVTGSHNPPEYNGFKMCVGTASLHGEEIQQLYRLIVAGDFPAGAGTVRQAAVIDR
ncbi:MAG: phosphomannomutase/phosphoglucomutase, partial [bacterium]